MQAGNQLLTVSAVAASCRWLWQLPIVDGYDSWLLNRVGLIEKCIKRGTTAVLS